MRRKGTLAPRAGAEAKRGQHDLRSSSSRRPVSPAPSPQGCRPRLTRKPRLGSCKHFSGPRKRPTRVHASGLRRSPGARASCGRPRKHLPPFSGACLEVESWARLLLRARRETRLDLLHEVVPREEQGDPLRGKVAKVRLDRRPSCTRRPTFHRGRPKCRQTSSAGWCFVLRPLNGDPAPAMVLTRRHK